MDRYADRERDMRQLHDKIVTDIIDTLREKGYETGDKVKYCYENVTFELLPDRLLISDSHTDFLGVDRLLEYLRIAMKVFPK